MADPHRNPRVDELVEEIRQIVWRMRFHPAAVKLLTELRRVALELSSYKDGGTGRW